MPQQ
ncbi:hypothetical protein YPPY53_4637, partial [Yersinia pestis PY-53]